MNINTNINNSIFHHLNYMGDLDSHSIKTDTPPSNLKDSYAQSALSKAEFTAKQMTELIKTYDNMPGKDLNSLEGIVHITEKDKKGLSSIFKGNKFEHFLIYNTETGQPNKLISKSTNVNSNYKIGSLKREVLFDNNGKIDTLRETACQRSNLTGIAAIKSTLTVYKQDGKTTIFVQADELESDFYRRNIDRPNVHPRIKELDIIENKVFNP